MATKRAAALLLACLSSTATALGWTCEHYDGGRLIGRVTVSGEPGAATMPMVYDAVDGWSMTGTASKVSVCSYWEMTLSAPDGREITYSCVHESCEKATCYAHPAPFDFEYSSCVWLP